MNRQALWHEAKSAFSYAYDEDTLHLVLRTGKNDLDRVVLVHGDPFDWFDGDKGEPKWRHQSETMTKRYQTRWFDFYFLAIKPPYLRTKYAFLLEKDNQTYVYGAKQLRSLDEPEALYAHYDLSEFFNFPYLNHEDLHHTPAWVKETVWYQIFTDRFYRVGPEGKLKWGTLPVANHQLYGGNLKGVTEKLPYLHDLGINGIYFTPLFKAPTAHKYDTTDYFQIDPQFGSNDDFKHLVEEAHRLGIKVMLDGVFNHAGFDHPYFQDVIANGADSPYAGCFFIDRHPVVSFPLDKQGRPARHHSRALPFKTFAFTPHMPKWNTADPLAEKHLLDCITYWIEQYDIDGWRLDVSNEISHDFLRQVKKASRKAKPDTFILGENWDAAMPWLQGDQLDSVMNYDLAYPLWRYFEQLIDLETFKDMVTTYLAMTPKNVMANMFNLVGCHDTIRIKRRFKDDARRVRLAYLFMFLSAGAPNIYYGDEVGLTGDQDPDNRRCMPWEASAQDLDFKAFVKELIRLRQTHASFRDSDVRFIDADVLVFKKQADHDRILVIMNVGKACRTTLPKAVHGTYVDLFNRQTIVLDDTIKLADYQYLVLQKEDAS
ncbi:MAG: glycoside hydrolase family 13 protein [Acholeplasmataceae bacterium]|nr:MAG: glycoside hydrolase family 13 protein [Acholeplasmataceae bacterium]